MKKNFLKLFKGMTLVGLVLAEFYQNVPFADAEVSTETNSTFTNIPINLTGNDVSPLVMMNISRDHQLSLKAYNDYSDLDGDGEEDTTYTDTIGYYGYFDSSKCYTYNTTDNRFVPAAPATGTNNHYCTGQWSGNFMNWASMTRIDIVRKMLYGGMRSTDKSSLTVLERQFLPTDAHSFAKYYAGSDINKLTPFSEPEITIANLTRGETSGHNQWSETNDMPPLIRVAKGNYTLWAANESWQCSWSEEHNTGNGNDSSKSGIFASNTNPSRSKGLGVGIAQGDYVARIEVCKSNLIGQEKCRDYNGTSKPIGLLQMYGEDDQIFFGLMTGSYTHNSSGGVLRKNIETFKNEIDITNGTFISSANGIVHNLNKLRMYGYDYSSGGYTGSHENCSYQQTGLVLSGGSSTTYGKPANEGNCSSWGNPMSEIYLESLRYLAGQEANTDEFTYDPLNTTKDSTLGLTIAKWSDPLNKTNYCAPLSVLNFNASVSTNDDDQMDGVSDLGTSFTAKELTDLVGKLENIDKSSWFISNNGSWSDDLCTSKNIGKGFGSFSGLCPEGPTQKGTYLMSGVAYYANTHRIRDDLPTPPSRSNSRDLMVTNYGIALATNVPKIEVMVNNKKVTILPAFRLQRATVNDPYGSGTLVDFKIVEKTATQGKFYVNWEVSAMGGDYDQDVWGIIEYSVSGDKITITTDSIKESASREQGFGYTISGTGPTDGVHFHSGQRGFDFNDPTGVTQCSNCQVSDGPTSYEYTANGSSAGVLKDSLWYTAKYGGFFDSSVSRNNIPDVQSEWDSINNVDGTKVPDNIPDNYFYATNPLQLENSLNRVFLNILQRASSGTAAAVVSNNVSGDGALYQAYYEPSRQDVDNNEVSWIGTVQALWLDTYGYLREDDGDAKLEGYFTDPVIEQFYDEAENKTRVRRFVSTKDDKFTPFYMQGTVTAYDSTSGEITFTVNDISGTVGSGPYSAWTVYNLTTGKTGTSISSSNITAVSSSKTFIVSPATSWFTTGDTIMVADFESTVIDFEDVKTLWNVREQLSFDDIDGTYATTQRDFTFPADGDNNGGRFIKTWIDTGNGILDPGEDICDNGVLDPGEDTNNNGVLDPGEDTYCNGVLDPGEDTNPNGVVDPGEFVDFDSSSINLSNYGFLNVASEADADNLVDYVRGKEISGYRNRTLKYDGVHAKVMRLADVVNATPTIVGAPQESLDLLYKDTSYGKFKQQYAGRRQVLYVGSNGGMLHAFNGGFYDADQKAFLTSGVDYNGNPVTEHPLGAEIWAYVPMNLLPHLKWLKDPDYSHVYYVDGKPKVFDAKIFDNTNPDHPGGWGTVLVVGMRVGGGLMTVDTAADGLSNDATPADNQRLRSAYIIMDITNPEKEPKLLAEIQLPDESFSTSYPAALTIKDKDSSKDTNKWYLTFGSGPTDLGGESTKTAKLYIFDLAEIEAPGSSTNPPTGCDQRNISGGKMKILSCDTKIANSFIGDPISVDWELDYKADSIYFGVVSDTDATSGSVMRFETNAKPDPADWAAPTTLINTNQPVVSSVTPGVDDLGQKWIFFGTGRLFVSADQLSPATQSIYGVKEDGATVNKTDLRDVTGAKVSTNGTLSGVDTLLTTFDKLEKDISSKKGWHLDLPVIDGVAGTAPATRVINESALTGSVLFTTAYQPGLDLCTGEGFSRLYGLYYKTGTAYPDPTVLGTTISGTEEYANPFIELGHGFATSASIHTGTGSGNSAVSVFTQLSTGATIRTEADTVTNVRSGMQSWTEK